MSELLTRVVDDRNFEMAWKAALANDLADGELAPSIRRFMSKHVGLAQLRCSVTDGHFRPSPLTEVLIPKDDGTSRALHVLVAADRTDETAIAQELTPALDPLVAPSPFAYRWARGFADAVRRLVELREDGFRVVARTDIRNCSPAVHRARLIRMLIAIGIPEGSPAVTLAEQPVLRSGSGRSRPRQRCGEPSTRSDRPSCAVRIRPGR